MSAPTSVVLRKTIRCRSAAAGTSAVFLTCRFGWSPDIRKARVFMDDWLAIQVAVDVEAQGEGPAVYVSDVQVDSTGTAVREVPA